MRSAAQCLPPFFQVFSSVSMRNAALLRRDEEILRISTQQKRKHDGGADGPPIVFTLSLRNIGKFQYHCVNTA